MSSTPKGSANGDRGITPADLQNLRFTRASLLRPGYVEAEEFSRQVTSEARAEYEEQVRLARENAGAIIQAAQEAAAKIAGGVPAGADTGTRSMEELQEQVAYLKAFGQACRVQLRSYLEALLADIETEWGRANPAALPLAAPAPPAQRSGREGGPGTAT